MLSTDTWQTTVHSTHTRRIFKRCLKPGSVQKINEVRQAEAEEVTDADPLEEDDGLHVLGEATSAMIDVACTRVTRIVPALKSW